MSAERPAPLPRTVMPYTSQPVPQPRRPGLGGAPSTRASQRPDAPPSDKKPSAGEPFSFQGRWDELIADKFVCSEKVKAMNQDNFNAVLVQNDITFVFFYDPDDKRSGQAKMNVRQAAGCTKRASHGYAAVNCAESGCLCKEVGVLSTPFFRVYSGLYMTDNDCDGIKTADQIRRMVENNKVPLPKS